MIDRFHGRACVLGLLDVRERAVGADPVSRETVSVCLNPLDDKDRILPNFQVIGVKRHGLQ